MLARIFTKNNILAQLSENPVGTPYKGDPGILHSTSSTALRLVHEQGIRGVIWTPQNNDRRIASEKLRQDLISLDYAEQLIVSEAVSDGNKELIGQLRGKARSVFNHAANLTNATLEFMKTLHREIDRDFIYACNFVKCDANKTGDSFDNRRHLDLTLRTRLVFIGFGPTTVLYDQNGQEISVPSDSFLIFKGGRHPDKEAVLDHRAPVYDEPQPRFYASTFTA